MTAGRDSVARYYYPGFIVPAIRCRASGDVSVITTKVVYLLRMTHSYPYISFVIPLV